MSTENIQFQDFEEHALDNPLICLSKVLSEKNKAVKDLKDQIVKSNFDNIDLSPEIEMKKAKKYQITFFEELKKYDDTLEQYNKLSPNSNDKEKLKDKMKDTQKACINAYKKFCDKYNNGWKKYNDMQLIYLKMYGELSSRKWSDIDG